MITNINKEKYLDLLEIFKKDKGILRASISGLKKNKKQEVEAKVSGIEEYYVRLLNSRVSIYSVYPGFLVVWPSEILYSRNENTEPYIILVKDHAVSRYAERYLRIEESNIEEKIRQAFVDSFCLSKTPVMIKKSETDKVDSLMCRIKDGALLGFAYKVNPRVLRFNTFVSDKELEEANREDQKRIRIGGKTWEKVK